MSDDLLIRRLLPDDVSIFRSIRLEGLAREPDAFASSLGQWVQLSDAEWRRHLTEPVFVAFVAGTPIGMMVLRLNRPDKMTHRAMLSGVYVRAAYRGAGIASKLLSEVIAFSCQSGIRQIELGVRADNAEALRFYTRLGFEEFGRLANGFLDERGATDEVLMVRHFL